MAISPDGNTLAAGCDGGLLQVWDVKTLADHRKIAAGDGFIGAVVFDLTGKYLYAASDSGIRRVDLKTGNVESINVEGISSHLAKWGKRFNDVDSLVISPDGKDLVIGSAKAIVWNLESARERFVASGARSVAVSPDGSQLALADDNTCVEVWDFHTGQRLKQLAFRGDKSLVAHVVRFSSDGKMLAAGLNGPNVFPSYLAIWRVATYSHPTVIVCHEVALQDMCFLPGTNTLVTGAFDDTIRFWDLDQLCTFKGPAVQPRSP